MDTRQKYTLIAFGVALVATGVYMKTMVVEPCPSSGKPPKTWVDIFVTSLPIAILAAGAVYFSMEPPLAGPVLGPPPAITPMPVNARGNGGMNGGMNGVVPRGNGLAVNNRAYGTGNGRM